jgi:hypothetical protein
MSDTGVCEVCGAPATILVQDLREGEPVQDAQGQLWATWTREGPVHRFCEAHDRRERILDRDGKEIPPCCAEEVAKSDIRAYAMAMEGRAK